MHKSSRTANRRQSGILLHVTSLPSPYGIGDLGPGAYAFGDFLARTKQSLWQVLPLNPTNQACGNSPYSISSIFAGNTNLISPEFLVRDGFLPEKYIASDVTFSSERCDYTNAILYKEKLLDRAYKNFVKNESARSDYKAFCMKNGHWLEDFAIFEVIKRRLHYEVWSSWDDKLRDRSARPLQIIKKEAVEEIEKTKFSQYLFFRQWFSLKRYCNEKGIWLVGDMSIYLDYNSSDVWTHSENFKLDKEKKCTHVAGVPPDYFSSTGQLWGNPVYRWDVLERNGFDWWVRRMEHNLTLFDIVRIDHFRGLVDYWEVPAGENTAINGKWVKAHAKNFFNTMLKHFEDFPIIAEDLGHITPEVREVLHHFNFPGMKVLLFAFGEDNHMHPYLPHTYDRNWVVYTGTHDNNTVRGWFENEATPDEKKRVFRYFGRELSREEISWEFIRLAMMSVANIAIIPLQDVLGLGENARMNIPSTPTGNWQWRFKSEELSDSIAHKLREMTEIYGRRAQM